MVLSHSMSGRLGNHCLQIYKTFLFATQRGIPFDCIKFDRKFYCTLFENIQKNFVQKSKLNKVDFNVVLDNCDSFDGIKFSRKTDNVLFTRYSWMYPNTPSELRLFNYLFDAPTLHKQALSRNEGLFNQKTIGYPIRRGDMLENNRPDRFRVMDEQQILEQVQRLIDDNFGLVKIVVTSDDLDWCREKLSCFGDKVEFLSASPPGQIMLLSFCDQVVNNGAFYRSADRVQGKWESTFGQIAQCLCASRHFLPPTVLDPDKI